MKESEKNDLEDGKGIVHASSMGAGNWLIILTLSVLWGGSFFFTGMAVREVPPLYIALSRVSIAAALLLAVVYMRGYALPSSLRVWGCFFVMGALSNVIAFGLMAWGQSHIESGLASILNATAPMVSVLLAHFVTRHERITKAKLIGVMLGWSGVAVLLGGGTLHGSAHKILAQFAVLGAVLSYSCAAIYARRFKDLPPVVIAACTFSCATVMLTPIVFAFETPVEQFPSIPAALSLLGLGGLSTAFAFCLFFKAVVSAGPTNVLLTTYLIPINAILFGWLGLNETLEWNAFAGMFIILCGLLIIDGRLIVAKKRNAAM